MKVDDDCCLEKLSKIHMYVYQIYIYTYTYTKYMYMCVRAWVCVCVTFHGRAAHQKSNVTDFEGLCHFYITNVVGEMTYIASYIAAGESICHFILLSNIYLRQSYRLHLSHLTEIYIGSTEYLQNIHYPRVVFQMTMATNKD